MKLFEMEGFLRGKCLPGDMKVNETNAEYLVRKFSALEQKLAESQREFRAADATIENLQMQVEKLAVENAVLMQLIDWPKQQCPTTGDVTDVEPADFIPSTSASLAEVRAQGVDMYAERKNNEMMSLHPDTHAVGSIAAAMSAEVKELREFAAQLRQGGAA